jgi:hypothetical protein
MARSESKPVRAMLSSGVYQVSYGFPASSAEAARFPQTSHRHANAWHHAFLYRDGEHILEWGDDNHSSFGWNALRLIPIPHGKAEDIWRTDWLDPGDNRHPATPSNYNKPRGIAHYNNHVELYNPKENWWFKAGGGRYDLTTRPATVTHRASNDPDRTVGWSGPTPRDFLRDESREQWFTGGAKNAVYNPAYDYHAERNAFLILGGGAGSDSPYDGCWIAEPNPEHPQRQPEPWRIRNLRLSGVSQAHYAPRYQWRAMGKFRQGTDWFYCWGGRLSQKYQPQFTITMSNRGHRINMRTGEVEELAPLPVYVMDGGVAYDPDLDLFLILGAPKDGPVTTESNYSEHWSVILYDPAADRYGDVTPAGFHRPRHPLGLFKHPGTGRIYVRTGANFLPPLPNDQSQNWKLHLYWWLKIEPV